VSLCPSLKICENQPSLSHFFASITTFQTGSKKNGELFKPCQAGFDGITDIRAVKTGNKLPGMRQSQFLNDFFASYRISRGRQGNARHDGTLNELHTITNNFLTERDVSFTNASRCLSGLIGNPVKIGSGPAAVTSTFRV